VRRAAAIGAILALLVAISACTAKPNPVARSDFDNLNSWSVYKSAGHAGQGKRKPTTVSTQDGILTITGTADGVTGGLSWTGHTQRYGQWDIRMRAPAGCSCYHPVVLLWGTGGGDGVNNANGEIDIVEGFQTAARDKNEFSVHYGDGSQMVGGETAVDMTGWHVYHLVWREAFLTTWIDDNPPYFTTRDASVLPKGSVDVAVQLDWFPSEPRTGGDTASMQVDYITQAPPPTGGPS
jgi:hypothetical protein